MFDEIVLEQYNQIARDEILYELLVLFNDNVRFYEQAVKDADPDLKTYLDSVASSADAVNSHLGRLNEAQFTMRKLYPHFINVIHFMTAQINRFLELLEKNRDPDGNTLDAYLISDVTTLQGLAGAGQVPGVADVMTTLSEIQDSHDSTVRAVRQLGRLNGHLTDQAYSRIADDKRERLERLENLEKGRLEPWFELAGAWDMQRDKLTLHMTKVSFDAKLRDREPQ